MLRERECSKVHRDLFRPTVGAGIVTQQPSFFAHFLPGKKRSLTLSSLVALSINFFFLGAASFQSPWGREENIRRSLTVWRADSGSAGPGMPCVSLAQWALIPISITQLHRERITSTQPLLRQAPSMDRVDTVKHQLLSACFAD